jgi:hypothetical protein
MAALTVVSLGQPQQFAFANPLAEVRACDWCWEPFAGSPIPLERGRQPGSAVVAPALDNE